MRRTKIVCTIGPATRGPHAIGKLLNAGMDVARLNLAHGTREQHAVVFTRLREEAVRKNRPLGILLDLPGPKIRTGLFPQGEVMLETNSVVLLVTDDVPGDAKIIPIGYRDLARDVKPGDDVLLNDGLVRLEVTEVVPEGVRARVIDGGLVSDNKGVHLPGGVRAPSLTDQDAEDMAWGRELGADFFAMSFVSSAADIERARKISGDVPLIAKIERKKALDLLDEISVAADGIMVARGDLGVELGPEKVPLAQKRSIEIANGHGKVVIVATEMLESMKLSPRPTRAEASDVANAVLDGADALMLSGETATGKYPSEAVTVMGRIVEEVESSARYRAYLAPPIEMNSSANAVANAAFAAARAMKIRVIAVISDSGGMVRLLSDYRPAADIVGVTTRPAVYRRLALYWGVRPLLCDARGDTDSMIAEAEARLLAGGVVKPGEDIVLTLGVPFGSGVQTNLLKIHRIGA